MSTRRRSTEAIQPCTLLAVDVGLRTGLAFYARDGRLRSYRSHNFGSKRRLRRGAHQVLNESPGLECLVLEGGGDLAEVWAQEAGRRRLQVIRITAEAWRQHLLYPRQQRSGAEAKQHADAAARRVIEWSGAPKPTSLRHDAAEAILAGMVGVIEMGWLRELPRELCRGA